MLGSQSSGFTETLYFVFFYYAKLVMISIKGSNESKWFQRNSGHRTTITYTNHTIPVYRFKSGFEFVTLRLLHK